MIKRINYLILILILSWFFFRQIPDTKKKNELGTDFLYLLQNAIETTICI